MPESGTLTVCPETCESVFSRLEVEHLTAGNSRIYWSLLNSFSDPEPHSFQLQVGRTGLANADDWEDVGLPVENTFYAIDSEQRVFGKTLWTHYRIELTTPAGVYYSEPTLGLGTLGRRDWLIAREILRKERLNHRLASQEGFLLKRRHYGPPCPDCLDHATMEVRNPDCETCLGTGFVSGYFEPLACVWAMLGVESSNNEIDGENRGTTDDIAVPARMLAVPLLFQQDIWIAKKTDKRYAIQPRGNAAELRGIPLIVQAELRLLPATHNVYGIVIPGQVA